jgi:hypothetical protein
MAGEEWPRRIVQKALNRAVYLHDDNSQPSMYDLRIGPADAAEVAIECVGAVNRMYTETWNVGPAKGSFTVPVAGNWTVEISPEARVKRVKQRLPQLLLELERRGISGISHHHWLSPADELILDEMDSIGIVHASRYSADYSGKVYLTMPGTGGGVDDKGTGLPKWLGDFLRNPDQADVLSKLQRSGATDCHAFVIASFQGVPWNVESYLTGSLTTVPSDPPDLPSPITEAWVVGGFGDKGLHWNGNAWRFVATRGPGITDAAE